MLSKFKVKNGLVVDSYGVEVTGSSYFTGSTQITGPTTISGSLTARGNSTIIGSGSSVFAVDGITGRIFSADDVISGSIYSISTIGGFPIMDIYHDTTIKMGQFNKYGLYISQSSVGINNFTPTYNLDVSGSVRASSYIVNNSGNNLLNTSTGNTYIGYTSAPASSSRLNVKDNIRVEYDPNRYFDIKVSPSLNDYVYLEATNTTGLVLRNSGNISIIPNDASHSIYLGSYLSRSDMGSNALYGTSAVDGYGLLAGSEKGIIFKTNITSGGGVIGNFVFHGSDYGAFAHRITAGSTSLVTTQISGQLQLHKYLTTSSFTGVLTGLLGFDSTGNVISVQDRVTGVGTAGQVTYWSGTSAVKGSSNLFWDNTNGRLGIGTSSPQNELSILGSKNAIVSFTISNTNNGSAAATSFNFGQSPNSVPYNAMYVVNYGSGWVGSGHAVSNSVALVCGAGATSGLSFVADATNAPIKFFTNNGSTSQKIQIFATGNLVMQNAGTFTDAGYRLDINGTDATAGALRVTGLNSTFDHNITINGISVGKGGNNISSNLQFGASALLSNTSGTFNNAFGEAALNSNTIGSRNTAIGVNSIRYNTTGNDNMAFGYLTLSTNTFNGSSNTAIGNYTLLSATTATNNVAIGYFALRSNTTGNDNIAIGKNAGYNVGTDANTTGNNNIFIGTNAIGTSVSESNKTWIGNSSTVQTWLGGNLALGQTSATALADLAGSTTSRASLRIRSGSAPTSPNEGDIWHMSGSLYMYSTATKRLLNTEDYCYGVFTDTTTQTVASINTPYSMSFNTTEESSSVYLASNTRMTVTRQGVYNLQFSAQLDNTSGGTQEIYIWVRKNGTDIPRSNTQVSVRNSEKSVAAWNIMTSMNANDYLELIWASTSTNVQISYISTTTSPTRPVTPSVIATMTRVA